MTASRIQQASVKLFVDDASKLDLDALIPVFHEWIREKKLPDHLLIDVADYRHVPNGPGVMLVSHEAHYGLDSGKGEPGFLYSRKRDAFTEAQAAMRDALKRAAFAASLLEQDERVKGLRFRTDNLELRVVSRLTAPNTAETRAALEPVWSGVLESAGYAGASFAGGDDPREAFSLRLSACSKSPSLAQLQSAL